MTKVKDTMNLPTVAVETEDKDLTSEEWEEINDKVPDRFELLQERYGGRGPQSYWEYQQYLDDFVHGAEDLDDCESIEDYVVAHSEDYDEERDGDPDEVRWQPSARRDRAKE